MKTVMLAAGVANVLCGALLLFVLRPRKAEAVVALGIAAVLLALAFEERLPTVSLIGSIAGAMALGLATVAMLRRPRDAAGIDRHQR